MLGLVLKFLLARIGYLSFPACGIVYLKCQASPTIRDDVQMAFNGSLLYSTFSLYLTIKFQIVTN